MLIVVASNLAVLSVKDGVRDTKFRGYFRLRMRSPAAKPEVLMAFVALASAALVIGEGGSIKGIWSVSNSQLATASTQAS